MTTFVCDTNATAKVHVEAKLNLMLCLWLFIRLWDHGVVSVLPFPSFPRGGFDFHEEDALTTH